MPQTPLFTGVFQFESTPRCPPTVHRGQSRERPKKNENAMKKQNMKAGVMGGARRCLAQVARKFRDNSDGPALALSVFTMPGPRHCGGVNTTVHSSPQQPDASSSTVEIAVRACARCCGQRVFGCLWFFPRFFPRFSEFSHSIVPQQVATAFTLLFASFPRFPGWVRREIGGLVNGKCNEQISGS